MSPKVMPKRTTKCMRCLPFIMMAIRRMMRKPRRVTRMLYLSILSVENIWKRG